MEEGSLLIVCRRGGKYYLHRINIKLPSGAIIGSLGEILPLVEEMFKVQKDEEITAAGCAVPYPNELFVIANRWKGIIEAEKIDIPTWTRFTIDPHFSRELQSLGDHFYHPFFLFGIDGLIYLLTWKLKNPSPQVYGGAFECFDYISNLWESLPAPPPFCQPSLDRVAGYVVDDQRGLVLFCFEYCKHVEFYFFSVLTKAWQPVSVETGKIGGQKYNPYFPYYSNKSWNDVIYPFYGRAELVDGVVYGCLLRTVVTYRLFIDEDSSSVRLQALGLYSFDSASAFSKGPLGRPLFHSRCINYLGSNTFCVVDTVYNERPDSIQAVYITTFDLQFNNFDSNEFDYDEPGGRINILDSTIRIVDIRGRSFGTTDARIIFCYLPMFRVPGSRFHEVTNGLSDGFTTHVGETVVKFCELFLANRDDMIDEAIVLYYKYKSELQKSKNPVVRFFLGHMEHLYNSGPEPDFLLLLNQRKDKGQMGMKGYGTGQAKMRSVLMICVGERDPCALYELEISSKGVVGGSLISRQTIKEKKGVVFRTASVGSLGREVYLFPNHWETSMIEDCFVVDVEKDTVVPKSAKPTAPKKHLTVIGCGSKLYVLSAPSELPDSIPKPAFECFDPASGTWETLKDAPFHCNSMDKEVFISGYAVVGYHILISLNNDDCDFFSYNVLTKEWMNASKEVDGDYEPFNGKAEYVDGKIYSHICENVYEFAVTSCMDDISLKPPIRLIGLRVVAPPVPWWQGRSTDRIVHLGDKMFCSITTGGCPFPGSYQFACISTFSVSKSDIKTLHSTIRVLENRDLGVADICYCFSQ